MSTTRRNPVAVVTGGTAGIGLGACKQLAAKGIDVILTSRSAAKGQAAVEEIQRSTEKQNVHVEFVLAELGDLSSVVAACKRLEGRNIDYLLLNAGFMRTGQKAPEMSKDGIESTVAVNHVAGCLMATKLTPIMEETRKNSPLENITPMITFVSSDLHNIHSTTGASKVVGPTVKDDIVRFLSTKGTDGLDGSVALKLPNSDKNYLKYDGTWFYKYSKLLNVIAAEAVQRRQKIPCNSMEPGFVPASELSRTVKRMLGAFGTRILVWNMYNGPLNWFLRFMFGQPVRTLEEAARSEVFALTQGEAGKYYRLDQVDDPTPLTKEASVVDGFWSSTVTLLKEKGFL